MLNKLEGSRKRRQVIRQIQSITEPSFNFGLNFILILFYKGLTVKFIPACYWHAKATYNITLKNTKHQQLINQLQHHKENATIVKS